MYVRLRKMIPDDFPEAMRLKEIAGWNQTAADWQRFLSYGSEGCFAAEVGGRLIGTVTTICYEKKFAWIGMLLVDPECRNQGVGSALLKSAIEYLESKTITCMKLDATPHGKPIYEKLGFFPEYEIQRWVLKRPICTKAAPSIPEIGKMNGVFTLDREYFGADRKGLLLSLLEEAPELALQAGDDAEIDGYAFGRHGSIADQLGPWMAKTKEAGNYLFDEFLRRSRREFVFVDCMMANSWALELIKSRGFEFSRPLTRMFRGVNHNPGRPEIFCSSLGPEFG